MDIEIKIGREVEGSSILLVPSEYKKVSRRHASLYWKDGVMTLEDNESSNGTFVNGKRIAKTKITEGDVVTLGGREGEPETYTLDLKKVFDSCIKAENSARTDYSKEFAGIKQAYIDYQQEVSKIKFETTKKTQMPLKIVSLVPGVAGLALFFIFEDNTIRLAAMLSGTVLSTIASFLTMGRNSSANDKMAEEITELQIKYQPRYCCPKCGMKYPFTTHWKKLEADGKCPNPKCNARFVNQ